MASPPPILLWFRKDLRLDDNLALTAAVETGRPVIPVYILDESDATIAPLGAAQRWWLHHSLKSLRKSLRATGNDLLLRRGPSEKILQELIYATGADTIFASRIHEPQRLDREPVFAEAQKQRGLRFTAFAGQLLHDPQRLATGSGGAFRVYTPFWNAFQRQHEPRPPVEAPSSIPAFRAPPETDDLDAWNCVPAKPDWAAHFPQSWTPGEAAAIDKLGQFLDGPLDRYKTDRDFPARPATSRLSPHLALGEISPFRIWDATRGLGDIPREDLIHFRKELVWREFCHHLLFHFPDLAEKNWNARFDALTWQEDSRRFGAWTRGMTGYPIVDAGMRQLWRDGIMHNRVRMIVGSFLVKDLLIDWRQGERWFRDTLVDADPASNPANWQWVAGTGADASPFFRVFNPILQGEKFDASGDYVRSFVTEIAGLPDKFIHRPFEAPAEVLRKAGIELGVTYPRPIVDHAQARQRALGAYEAVKRTA